MIVNPIKTRIFQENENLVSFIRKHIKKIPERSVLVVTSKIVALSEGRTAIVESEETKVKLIKEESVSAIKTKYVWLTVKDGMLMASAGIDESNAKGKLILLPKNSFTAAEKLWKELKKTYKIKQLGILITDSHTAPLRAGVTGVALGYAGFKGLKDYRNTNDIFGRKFHFSQTNIADGLAAAAVLTMGEGKEKCPLAIIKKTSVVFSNKVDQKELFIDIHDDMYGPLLEKLIEEMKK